MKTVTERVERLELLPQRNGSVLMQMKCGDDMHHVVFAPPEGVDRVEVVGWPQADSVFSVTADGAIRLTEPVLCELIDQINEASRDAGPLTQPDDPEETDAGDTVTFGQDEAAEQPDAGMADDSLSMVDDAARTAHGFGEMVDLITGQRYTDHSTVREITRQGGPKSGGWVKFHEFNLHGEFVEEGTCSRAEFRAWATGGEWTGEFRQEPPAPHPPQPPADRGPRWPVPQDASPQRFEPVSREDGVFLCGTHRVRVVMHMAETGAVPYCHECGGRPKYTIEEGAEM